MKTATVATLIRPYAWLALGAFVTGFAGCLAVTWPHGEGGDVSSPAAMASAPASQDWNLPKAI